MNDESSSTPHHQLEAIDEAPICPRCGYNLRGLRWDASCPECGARMAPARLAHLLRFADPHWLLRTATGVRLLLLAALLYLGPMLARQMGFNLRTITDPAYDLCFLIAAWLATTPNPADAQRTGWSAGKISRVFLVSIPFSLMLSYGFNTRMPVGREQLVYLGTIFIAQIGWYVCVFALYAHLGQIAARIPERGLIFAARFLRWAFLVQFVAAEVGGFLFAFYGSAVVPARRFMTLYGYFSAGMTYINGGLTLMAAAFFVRYRRALLKQADVARTGSPDTS